MARLKVAGSCWEAEQRMIRAEEQAKENAMEAGRLRAEVAALRAQRTNAEHQRNNRERELAEARALLAALDRRLEMAGWSAEDNARASTRAFLRRDEARQVARWNPSARQCSGEGCTTFGHGEKCPARDEARQCRVCGPEPWAQNHAEHADAARDEARRVPCEDDEDCDHTPCCFDVRDEAPGGD